MKRPSPTIDELCEKYRNENAHTGHVTSLALLLFDMCRDWLGLPGEDRRYLDAAARLHDIGYALDPACHAVAGAHIVLREGVRGFDAGELPLITGIMLLHSGPLKEAMDSPMFEAVKDRPRALRLGALLRMADGLDHGHLQDASIENARRTERLVEITVRSELAPANLTYAEQKADLWRATFPVDIRILPTPAMAGRPPPLLTEDQSIHEAVQRLLLVQHRILVDNLAGVVAGRDMESLHAFRTALRRSRTLLRLFRKQLEGTSAETVRRRLAKLRREIGPARDMDVWLAMLRAEDLRRACGKHPRWTSFVQAQVRERELLQVRIRRRLAAPSVRALRVELGVLLRVDLPRAAGAAPRRTTLRMFASQKLARAIEEVRKSEALAHSQRAKELHRFRKALRRIRHLGEFFGPVMEVSDLAARVRVAERELGRAHDIEVGLERLRASPIRAPDELARLLRKRRDRHLARFRLAWKHARKRAPFKA